MFNRKFNYFIVYEVFNNEKKSVGMGNTVMETDFRIKKFSDLTFIQNNLLAIALKNTGRDDIESVLAKNIQLLGWHFSWMKG